MQKFAKIFESEKYGQILVKVDADPEDCAPEVRYYCYPPNFGVCSTALHFEDSDEGWDRAEEIFEGTNLVVAESAVDRIFELSSECQ